MENWGMRPGTGPLDSAPTAWMDSFGLPMPGVSWRFCCCRRGEKMVKLSAFQLNGNCWRVKLVETGLGRQVWPRQVNRKEE